MNCKKMLLVIIIICLIMLPISRQGWAVSKEGWPDQQGEQEYIPIDQVFAFIGCQREYLNVNGWGRLDRGYMSLETLELITKKAAKFFEVKQDYDFFSNEGKNIRQVNIRGINKKGQVISIVCHSTNTSAATNKECESYIVVDIVDSIQDTNSLDVKVVMKDFFDTLGINGNITTTLVGSIEGELAKKDMEDICRDLFYSIKANRVEGISEEKFMSISGYSPLLVDNVMAGENPINIQVAMRYNSYKGRTYLWVGTPIISIEY